MNTAYIEVPAYPLTDNHYPGALRPLKTGQCIHCKARWTTARGYDGEGLTHPSYAQDIPIPPYPHIAYLCGGIWREVDGVWVGKCWASRNLQLTLALEEA
jgi:hypothetical protein